MDKLRGMETFIAVVESGSFTGAAARLEMSAGMVGQYIAWHPAAGAQHPPPEPDRCRAGLV